MSDIANMIANALDKNYAEANGDFANVMAEKMAGALDAEKAIVAAEIYNGVERSDVAEEFEEFEETE